MKSILFILTSFRHGGTNKSLENLLSLIDTDAYRVDVFAMEHYGPYKEMLPNCTILPEDKWLSALIAHWADLKGFAKIRSFFIKILRSVFNKLNYDITFGVYKKALSGLVKNKNYDAVIAYSEGAPTSFISFLCHPNKIAWIHCDYSSYMKLNNYPDEKKIYESYKAIVCVSEYTKNKFDKIIPEIKDKSNYLHNLLNVDQIERNAKNIDNNIDCGIFTLISIGSFYPIKRLSFIPDIANELLKRSNSFKWLVIANINNNNEFNSFKNKIVKYNLSDYVVYLGEKKNPYPYLKNSDLFVTLSTTEACPYVVNESKYLKVPIISTDFPSAPEFIDNAYDGFIMPIEDIVDKIELMMRDKKLYDKIKMNISGLRYDNEKLMKKFYSIIQ